MLKTSYLGLEIKSPVIVSSSRLTSNVENIRVTEENGAGAVVLKSLFEEQIMYNIQEQSVSGSYPEADEYISSYVRAHSVDSYIDLIREAKKNVSIPVIASINCYSTGSWIDFAKRIEDAKADALEINAFFMPIDKKASSSDTEKKYFEIIERLLNKISIPLVMKIGQRFTNVLYMVDQFHSRQVKGVVMFNRFFEPDIDIQNKDLMAAPIFSENNEMRYVLRWIAMASALNLKIDISASTGVKNGDDVIKYLLAGANTVQVCSALYKNGLPYIRTINDRLIQWMKQNNHSNIDEFRGMLNWKNSVKPFTFERTQFMRYFSSVD